jgi:uncharacterized protein (TIGR00290 family)
MSLSSLCRFGPAPGTLKNGEQPLGFKGSFQSGKILPDPLERAARRPQLQELFVASPVVLSFSGGKDSVLALERLRADGWDVRALLAAVVDDDATLAMHGVPERLVALQAASLGVPLVSLRVPREPSNTVYEARLAAALEPFRAQGVRHVAFGDLFLADIKAYRDALMARLGFEPVYPLWHEDTRGLAKRFVDGGYRGLAICVDTAQLAPTWAGRELDADFFAGLPPGTDPCGENGEFHTFVYDGPGFFYPVRFERDGEATRGHFAYARLRPLAGEACAHCGATFECGMKAGVEHCWCEALPQIAPSAAFTTCLCPRCLRDEIATRQRAPVA